MATTRQTAQASDTAGPDGAATSAGATTTSADNAFNAVAEGVRDLNRRLSKSYRAVGLAGVGAYDRAIETVARLETRTASVTRVSWVESAVRTHSELLQDLGSSYSKAARSLLA
jgi:hypothetical protein